MPLEFAGSQVTGARARRAWRSRIDEGSRSPRQILPAGEPPSPCLRLGTLARSPGRDAGSVSAGGGVHAKEPARVGISGPEGRSGRPGRRWPQRPAAVSALPSAAFHRVLPTASAGRYPGGGCGAGLWGGAGGPARRSSPHSRPHQQLGAPLPAAGPPPRQRGAGIRGLFGRFRRALGSFRVRGGAGQAPVVGCARRGRGPSQCARAAQGPRTPAPPPGPRTRAAPSPPGKSRRRWRRPLQRLESACRAWRRRREEAGARREEGQGRAGRLRLGASVRARRRSHGPIEGRPGRGRCTPRAKADPGPASPRRLAAPTRSAPRAGGCVPWGPDWVQRTLNNLVKGLQQTYENMHQFNTVLEFMRWKHRSKLFGENRKYSFI
nr:collagen alpha-1(I) chain-like [Pan troglodytes]